MKPTLQIVVPLLSLGLAVYLTFAEVEPVRTRRRARTLVSRVTSE